VNDGTNRGAPMTAYRRPLPAHSEPTNLADLLERVLDKGIVIAGDITLALATIDILTIKVRLLIASVDKAQEMGINWWQSDPFLSSKTKELEDERDQLLGRIRRLEARLGVESDEAKELDATARDEVGDASEPEGGR